jgi:hypothetical protein
MRAKTRFIFKICDFISVFSSIFQVSGFLETDKNPISLTLGHFEIFEWNRQWLDFNFGFLSVSKNLKIEENTLNKIIKSILS